MSLQFSATRSCEALVHSPCRSDNYTLRRRRLYHQNSPGICVADGRRPSIVRESPPDGRSLRKMDSNNGEVSDGISVTELANRMRDRLLSRQDSQNSNPRSAGATPKLGRQ